MTNDNPVNAAPVAVIGMDCIFPGANSPTEFWRIIRRGEDCISQVPETHWSAADYFDADPRRPDMTYCTRGGFLSPIPFDPTEFGIPPTILEATDTTQLLSLIVAKRALDDAGYGNGRDFSRDRVSVILGVTGTQELVLPLSARLGHPKWRRALAEAGVDPETAESVVQRIAEGYVSWQENSFPGLLGNVVAGRIANRLNLRGTNCVVDAACASSLSAVHLALLELAAGRCDMALTGGADTLNDIFMYMCFAKTTALSATGDARPFSDKADGTVLGEGVGILVLKRLADAERDGDRIYAVLRAVGTSSDGRSQSIYAPNADGQARALRDAHRLTGFGPDSIDLIEAHGTGTLVGDAAEFEALRSVFASARSDAGTAAWCALGSVKSQIGHTKAAAGVAGLIKAILAIYNRTIPPSIKADSLNPALQQPNSPLYLCTESRPWIPRGRSPRRAGVSSFGFGGSNYHAVVEEHRATLPEPAWDGSVQIIALSAASTADLHKQLDEWSQLTEVDHFDEHHLAYHAARSRRQFRPSDPRRLLLVLQLPRAQGGKPSLAHWLRERLAPAQQRLDPSGPEAQVAQGDYYGAGTLAGELAFLVPGQGSQYVGMGRDLACTFPEMIDTFAEAHEALDEPNDRLAEHVFPIPAFARGERRFAEERLSRTDAAQPAIGAVSLGMARVLQRFGLRPDFAAGHSYGELVALCLAGRIDAPTLHRLSRLRGRLMVACDGTATKEGAPAPLGAMLAIKASEQDVARLLRDGRLALSIANHNAPAQCVVSGPREHIGLAFDACRKQGISATLLKVSGAFHSDMIAPALGPFRNALEAIDVLPPQFPIFSNVSGQAYPHDRAETRRLLAEQLVRPVDFVAMIENLYHAGARTFLEVGPRTVLTGLVREILDRRGHHALALDDSSGSRDGRLDMARSLAQLAALGHGVDLSAWERPVSAPRTPRMVVELVGANYRTPAAKSVSKPAPIRHEATQWKPRTASVNQQTVQRQEPAVAHPETMTLTETAPNDSPLPEDPTMAVGQTGANDPPAKAPPLEEGSAPPFHEANGQFAQQALRFLEDGLVAMQRLQQKTAEAHERVLEGQAQAHRIVQQLLDSQQRLLDSALAAPGTPFAEPRALVPAFAAAASVSSAPPILQAPHPGPQQVQPPTRLAVEEEYHSIHAWSYRETARPQKNTPPEPRDSTDSRLPAAGPIESIRAALAVRIREVVCEKTSYPPDMIQMEMDIEADLGIDSIKRVEILAALSERIDGFDGLAPEHVGRLRTLDDLLDFIAATQAPSGPGACSEPCRTAEAAVSPDAGLAPSNEPTPARAGRATRDPLAPTLLEIVARLTGYPQETLDLDMDIESDLGIDSIKRVEILAAFEERIPDLPPVRPERMAQLRTLRQIVEYCGQDAHDLSTAPTSAATPMQESCPPSLLVREPLVRESILTPIPAGIPSCDAAQPDPIHPQVLRTHFASCPSSNEPQRVSSEFDLNRRTLTAVALTPALRQDLIIAPGREIWITDDGAGLSAALLQRFTARGLPARLVGDDQLPTEKLANLGGLILVAQPRTSPTALWSPRTEDTVKRSFLLIQAVASSLLEAAANGGALLVTISRMDGAFGLLGGDFDPAIGGLAGLLKTAAREWPHLRCRAIDVAGDWLDLDAAAYALADELLSAGPIEVGLVPGRRYGLELARGDAAPAEADIAEGDVFVVTGGARGVTAEAAIALARRYRPTLVLLGRTPLRDDPSWLVGLCKEREIKAAIRANDFKDAERIQPKAVNTAYAGYTAQREIRRNLDRMRGEGAQVIYHSVDVCDADAVRAVLDEARRTLGPVRGLIHGAGRIEDRRIPNKTPEQFAAVFDAKVRGLRCLLEALPLEELRHVVLFSSVSARCGNQGQIDYAAANEVLNKVAQQIARRLPHCRVVSLNWGPWDGGMVHPALRQEFTLRGVRLIPLDAGGQAVVDELANRDRAVEVILGATLDDASDSQLQPDGRICVRATDATPASVVKGCEAQSTRDQRWTVAFHRLLDLERHPFMQSHIIEGRPVLPAALMIEWLAHAAVHAHPGLHFCGFDNFRVCKGVVHDGEPVDISLHFSDTLPEAAQLKVEVELRTKTPSRAEFISARCIAILAPEIPQAPQRDPVRPPLTQTYDRGVSGAYAEVLFHGPHLHVFDSIIGLSERGMAALVRLGPKPEDWMNEPLRSEWLTEPLALDAAFQLASLWCHEIMGSVSLPAFVRAYRQFVRQFPSDGVRVVLSVADRTSHRMTGDFDLFDLQGQPVARVTGCEFTIDPSLNAAFKRRALRTDAAAAV